MSDDLTGPARALDVDESDPTMRDALTALTGTPETTPEPEDQPEDQPDPLDVFRGRLDAIRALDPAEQDAALDALRDDMTHHERFEAAATRYPWMDRDDLDAFICPGQTEDQHAAMLAVLDRMDGWHRQAQLRARQEGITVRAEGRGVPTPSPSGNVMGSLASQVFGTSFTQGGPRYRHEAG